MEGTESTNRARATGKDGNQEVDQTVLMSSKPLHRFVQKEPRSLGIAIVIFGCAELLMGFSLGGDDMFSSLRIYIPFWQGILLLVCGSLSIYTGLHPSKKMVTVSLAMYVVTLFGIIVSVGYRIYCLSIFSHLRYRRYWMSGPYDKVWDEYRWGQLFCLEAILLTFSLCVLVLLIFLCTIARLALRSTRTQVIVQHIPPPPSTTKSN